jgi:nitric oxide reductase activation protein
LEKNGVTFAVVEHRGNYAGKAEVNVLRPFKAKPLDKYNILKYRANGGTRDGLTLMWARDYFKKHSGAGKRLLINITDGVPADKNYEPPVSLFDTRKSVAALKKAGIETVALALIKGRYELDAIKTIYENIVLCDRADELPAKVMEVVGKVLR